MAKTKPTAKDQAATITQGIYAEMREGHSNLGAWLIELSRAPRGVQTRVLDAIRGPKKIGAPLRPLSDEEWLNGFEAHREWAIAHGQIAQHSTDLDVIRHWLEHLGTRFNGTAGKEFRRGTISGEKEVRSLRDAISRARRNRRKGAKTT